MDLKLFMSLARNAFSEWGKDNASMLAAGLAYYTIFSLAPLLMMVIAVVGLFLGPGAVEGDIVLRVKDVAGDGAANIVRNILKNVTDPASMLAASLVGTVFLLAGALSLFTQARRALNIILNTSTGDEKKIVSYLKSYGLSFILLLFVGFLLVATAILTVSISSVVAYIQDFLPVSIGFVRMLNMLFYFMVVTILLAFTYKLLAGVKLSWGDVFIGSTLTAMLFTFGTVVVNIYIGYGNVGSVYGAASSLLVLLLWIYYLAQIFLFGAEFIKVYSRTRGSRRDDAPQTS